MQHPYAALKSDYASWVAHAEILLRRLLMFAVIASALAAPIAAAQPAAGPVQIGVRQLWRVDDKQDKVTLVQAPAPAAIIDTGTIAGQVITWVYSVFGGTIGIALTGLIVNVLKKNNIQISDSARARLQELVVNGLHAGAEQAAKDLPGKGVIEVKNATLANAVRYVQVHGADTIKQLGQDPIGQVAVEAIKARALAAIADPDVATPKIMDADTSAQQAPKG